MSRYTYTVEDAYNFFGAGHNYRLTLWLGGREARVWYYESILGIGTALIRRKIRKLECVYGAVRR